LTGEEAKMARIFLSGGNIIKGLQECPNMMNQFHDSQLATIRKELNDLKRGRPSLLRMKDDESLKTFSWKKLHDELAEITPTFLTFVKSVADGDENKLKREMPAILSAAATLINVNNREMSALHYIQSFILLKGGAKKSAFTRLNAMKSCMSYYSTMDKANEFAAQADVQHSKWKSIVWDDRIRELEIMNALDNFGEDSIETRSRLENELTTLRNGMHPGYYIVGDNVDMRTHVRHQRLGYTDLDAHMFQLVAYENRVPGNHLNPTSPIADIKTAPFSSVMPSYDDDEEMHTNMA
jgi:hypothetical protein